MSLRSCLLLLAAPVALAADPTPKPVKEVKPVTVEIRMVDGLRFEPARFEVPAGASLVVKLRNEDTTHQVHNFLVTEPGQRAAVVQAALELGDQGPVKGYVPATPAVLAHSGLVNPEERAEVKVQLPPAKGVYPFVCTFPGHGFVMYGAIYAGEKPPSLAKDPHLPPQATAGAVAGGGRRPFVQRMFLPGASPAAIAVALPGEWNYAWDASTCRLRSVWKGGFIDASKYWAGNGNARAEILGVEQWQAPTNHTAFAAAELPSFGGYALRDGLPTFQYRVGAAEVRERLEVVEPAKLRVTYSVTGGAAEIRGPGPGWTRAPASEKPAGAPASAQTVMYELPLGAAR